MIVNKERLWFGVKVESGMEESEKETKKCQKCQTGWNIYEDEMGQGTTEVAGVESGRSNVWWDTRTGVGSGGKHNISRDGRNT